MDELRGEIIELEHTRSLLSADCRKISHRHENCLAQVHKARSNNQQQGIELSDAMKRLNTYALNTHFALRVGLVVRDQFELWSRCDSGCQDFGWVVVHGLGMASLKQDRAEAEANGVGT